MQFIGSVGHYFTPDDYPRPLALKGQYIGTYDHTRRSTLSTTRSPINNTKSAQGNLGLGQILQATFGRKIHLRTLFLLPRSSRTCLDKTSRQVLANSGNIQENKMCKLQNRKKRCIANCRDSGLLCIQRLGSMNFVFVSKHDSVPAKHV